MDMGSTPIAVKAGLFGAARGNSEASLVPGLLLAVQPVLAARSLPIVKVLCFQQPKLCLRELRKPSSDKERKRAKGWQNS